MRISLPKPLRAPVAPVVSLLLATTVLVGCAEAEEIARDAAGQAGCAVGRQAVAEAEDRARRVVDDLRADPQAAERELRALGGVLEGTARQLDGEVRTEVDRARRAVDALLAEARQAADGTRVDDVAVEEAQGELDRALEELTAVC